MKLKHVTITGVVTCGLVLLGLQPVEFVALVGCAFAVLYLLSCNGWFDKPDANDKWRDL